MSAAETGKTLIDQLVKAGVDTFCIAPGFRSTPLVLALAEDSRVKTTVHFDERGAGFHALGHAKASGKPAAVVVTSGTACGNLMPAVMEASAAHLPLLLITCDRPEELLDTMANQVADQVKLFGDYARYYFQLPTPRGETPPPMLATTIAQAVHRTKAPLAGPVQLNCPFAEPFFEEKSAPLTSLTPTEYISAPPRLSDEQARHLGEMLSGIEKGVILLGSGANAPDAERLAEKLGWPIFADLLSSHRQAALPNAIPYYHHILKSKKELRADLILHIGDAFISKAVLEWMRDQRGCEFLHVAPHPKRCDPFHLVTSRIVAKGNDFCNQVAMHVEPRQSDWLAVWQRHGKKIDTLLRNELRKNLTEASLPLHLSGPVFFGNSMPVRDADMFLHPKTASDTHYYANRGLSGIDGNIATAAGIAAHHPLTMVMGDQTLLHDLNSLSLLKTTKHPVKLIVINNGGGGIFSFVAISKRKDVLNPYFAAAHNTSLEAAAKLFDLTYARVETAEELQNEEAMFIEFVTNREENFQLHLEIDRAVQEILCTSFCTAS